MRSMFKVFSQSIQSSSVSPKRLVLAYSGGVDSQVMLELMVNYREHNPSVECFAVHVHHGLSDNADFWAQHCSEQCKKVNVPLVIESVTLDLSQSESIEKLARDARYQALDKNVQAGDLLLTGQHSDDQVETFLLALKRGSGPKGLASMAVRKRFGLGELVRPLLGVPRCDIEQYAEQHKLNWIEDESNQDQRFERNFVRHQVTPQLVERWPTFRDSVRRSAELCAEQEMLLDELLNDHLQLAVQPDMSLSIAALSEHSSLLRSRLIRMWLSQLECQMPSQKQLLLIWQEVALAQVDANPELVLAGGTIRRFANKLYLVAKVSDVSSWQSEVKINQSLELPDSLGKVILSNQGLGRIRLPEHPDELSIIFNPEGLSAHPVDRGHSRKLKKLFQEYQVPSWLRRRTPILMYKGKVVAVAGLFVDQAFDGQDCDLIWSKAL
ncbi:tRNA lysidine(34) synthetase TilS [Vibrio makurazakiensis]|uniref:tRNA lysidine(34) synthetase TilS n=1 Tax=Vibrio makurazakiensis TaxID=2910250 RepID=UPI003D0CC3FC